MPETATAEIQQPVIEAPKPLSDDSVGVDEYVQRRMKGEKPGDTPEPSEATQKEAKKTAESETAATKGSEEGKSKTETKPEVKAGEKDDEELPPGVKKRFDKLTAKRKEAEDKAEALQSELDKIRAGSKTAAESTESDPEPKETDFKDYRDFVKAQARWETRQELREQAEKQSQDEEQARTKEVFDSHNQRIADARSKIEDFDEVVGGSKISFSRSAGLAIYELDNGPEVMYHLASHPEEMEALSKLSPIRQIAKLGQISASLLPSGSVVEAAPKTKPTTKAPEPITPVTASSSGKKSLNDPEIPMDEYYRRRMADKRK